METFFALLAIYAGNSPVSCELPAQRPVTQSFDVFFDLRLNKLLSKQWWGWWLKTLSRPSWRHWGQMTHICISKLTIICSGNGLSWGQQKAIIWTDSGHSGHKPKRPKPKRPQTETAVNRNGHRQELPQTKTATSRKGHRPEQPQT